MVYAYDQNIQYPVKDLYDNQIIAMSIAAAKDMYEKGQQEIKDFQKEYGDFLSPIAADMDWYSKNVTGKVRDTINYLYANGIDPIRSAEGRAAVSRVINSMPIGEIAQKRSAAKDAEVYKKNRDDMIKAGLYNEAYERAMLGGQTLEEWDGSLGNWKATSPMPYKDLNSRYKHLFDGMQLSYDEEESKKMPGWIVKTKSKKDMRTILDANLVDLQNDPQFKYDVANIKNAIRNADPNASEQELDNKATDILKQQIIDRNHEVYGKSVEVDPYYKQAIDHQWQLKMQDRQYAQQRAMEKFRTDENIREAREKAKIAQQYPKPGSKGSTESGDYMGARMQEGVQHYYTVNNGVNKSGKYNTYASARDTRETFISLGYDKAKENFLERNIIKNQFNPQTIIHGIADPKDIKNDASNTIYIGEGKTRRLYTDDDIVTNTQGVPRKKDAKWQSRKEKGISDYANGLYMEIVGDGITVPGKDFKMHQYVKVHVYDPNSKEKDKGYMWYEYQEGMENAGRKRENQETGVTTYAIQQKPFEYEWGQDQWGYYNPIHVKTEKYLGNSNPERIGEE